MRLDDLARAKERAEALSRARTAFLAAMSHEFRTPMNAVIGLSEIVLDSPPGQETRHHVRAISDSARALLRLLEDILDFAKIDAQKLALACVPFDLRQLSESVIAMLRPAAADRSVSLSVEIASAVPVRVLGDDARLRQVLVNLLGNAVKFTRHGTVRLDITPATDEAAADCRQAIRFRVEDTGEGILPEVMGRLFRPFEQGDVGHARRHGGTGLGLSISKQIVAAMDGDIQVESEPGRGSVFSFTIRLAAAEPEPVVAVVSMLGRQQLSILVVDDHPINREVAHAKLSRLGHRVELVEDGAAAVTAVSQRDYDVVFMDLHMPGMHGLVATAQIREVTAARRPPHIVAMTASVFEEDREACRRAGMSDFIGKPVDLDELDAVLGRITAGRGPVPTAACLSRGPLDELRSLSAAGDPLLFGRVCRAFLSDAPQRIAQMRAALGAAQAEALALAAHTLKAASAALGAHKLSALCEELEALGHGGDIRGAEHLIAKILDLIDLQLSQVHQALLTELARAETPLPGAA